MSSDPMTAKGALKKLLEGNKRYAGGSPIHPNQSQQHRTALLETQSPFAVIMTCADSRVSPEIIFDQGLGDLFVTRVAGNVASDFALGTIEYAAIQLNVPLVIVVGHSSCAAVQGAMNISGISGQFLSVAKAIKPAIDRLDNHQKNDLETVIRENAQMVAEQIRSSGPLIADLVSSGKLTVLSAFYNFSTGLIDIIS
ncbi:MAG: carbonic anhydrase [Calditrichaceae bacterium]